MNRTFSAGSPAAKITLFLGKSSDFLFSPAKLRKARTSNPPPLAGAGASPITLARLRSREVIACTTPGLLAAFLIDSPIAILPLLPRLLYDGDCARPLSIINDRKMYQTGRLRSIKER